MDNSWKLFENGPLTVHEAKVLMLMLEREELQNFSRTLATSRHSTLFQVVVCLHFRCYFSYKLLELVSALYKPHHYKYGSKSAMLSYNNLVNALAPIHPTEHSSFLKYTF